MKCDPVLITGAGRRVGLHLARRFIEDGIPVIAHYHRDGEEIRVLRDHCFLTIQAPLDDPQAILDLSEQVKTKVGSLRGIVHNASMYTPTILDPLAIPGQFQGFWTIHMLAPYLLNTQLQGLLSASSEKPADIIHISDIYAERPNPDFDLYCSTKAGLENLSWSFAQRFAPDIKVNCIRPGPILFPLEQSSQKKAAILRQTPLAREGGAESVYRAIKSIFDNDFMTGAVIPVDGGRHLTR